MRPGYFGRNEYSIKRLIFIGKTHVATVHLRLPASRDVPDCEPQELIGGAPLEPVYEEDRERACELLRRTMRNSSKPKAVEVELETANSQLLRLAATAVSSTALLNSRPGAAIGKGSRFSSC